ncbi:hypothetical protein COU75_04370 [Candidatus Peregrinibacteria bacterium CG10_big_fil_rev_8_21_14_0_10_42_8]|nr:MAG: hypothetical protein COU75_04370 [Candidatus Peregrinibacteria bacterium CG10_big_fil_rev_8_21_14_0_10_42_8]
MKNKLFLCLLAIPLLTGCSSAEERRNAALGMFKDVGETASGTVNTVQDQVNSVIDLGKSVKEGVTDMVEDAQKRINQVQSGVDLLMQGKELIESGVQGDEQK